MLFATATDWVTRLTDAHRAGRLPNELARLRRYGLIIVDDVGYLPFEQDAANPFFQPVSSLYEHASLVLISNLPFSGWGGVFGDQAVAAAMIDRIVHHADVRTLKGATYRLRGRGIDSLPSIRTTTDATESKTSNIAHSSAPEPTSFAAPPTGDHADWQMSDLSFTTVYPAITSRPDRPARRNRRRSRARPPSPAPRHTGHPSGQPRDQHEAIAASLGHRFP